MKLTKILHGGDYNPEQWLDRPDILAQDITYMKEAGINTVTMGMFSWSMLEPVEGVYSFSWLKEIADRLYENGISTILGTPSGARPKWLADRYPEVLRVNADRTRNLYGGRHNHCFTSPIYREKVTAIDQKLGETFQDHPGVILWHISNEFGGECHCPLCQKAFQGWLKRHYASIEEVNDKWATTFWSHRYQSFGQIESPSPLGESSLHGLTLDWKRFVSDQTADFAACEVRALKKAGVTAPTTTNLMYDYLGLNYDVLAREVDVVSLDSYPVWHKGDDLMTALDQELQHDYMRCLKQKPFLLMESCPSATNWQDISKLKRPGLLAASALSAIAHGSDSSLYFQIRQSRGASEKFHGAVIDHYGGNDTRVFQEVKAFGLALPKLSLVAGSSVSAKVAVIYDTENHWAIDDAQGPRNKGMFYHEAVMKSYSALRRLGFHVDVISEAQELSSYQLVAAPMLYLFRENMEQKIRHFVESGGTLVLTAWSGIVDRNDLCYLGGTPGTLMDVFGVRRTETDALFDEEENLLCLADAPCRETNPGKEFRPTYVCSHLCDLLKPSDGTSVLFRYGKDFYCGIPAVTEHVFGKGHAFYIGTEAEASFYMDFYRMVTHQIRLKPLTSSPLPQGITISSRENEQYEFIFLQNFSNSPVTIREILEDLAKTHNQEQGTVLYGRSESGLPAGTLSGYESLVLQWEKRQ